MQEHKRKPSTGWQLCDEAREGPTSVQAATMIRITGACTNARQNVLCTKLDRCLLEDPV